MSSREDFFDFWQISQPLFKQDPAEPFFPARFEPTLKRIRILQTLPGQLIAVAGESGVGTSLLARNLYEKTLAEESDSILLTPTETKLPDQWLLQKIAIQCGVVGADQLSGGHHSRLLPAIARHMDILQRQNRGYQIVIDNAENLFQSTVVQDLTILLRLASVVDEVVTIVLIGKPNFFNSLQKLESLVARVSFFGELAKFSFDDTQNYIMNKLSDGTLNQQVFNKAAIRTIHRCSQGVMGTLIRLLDACLVEGYVRQQKLIDEKMVKQLWRQTQPSRSLQVTKDDEAFPSQPSKIVDENENLGFNQTMIDSSNGTPDTDLFSELTSQPDIKIGS